MCLHNVYVCLGQEWETLCMVSVDIGGVTVYGKY